MVIMILSVIGVVLFVVGISFVFRGYLSVRSESSVVPRPDYEALQKNFNLIKESGLKVKNELESVKIESNNTRAALKAAQRSEEGLRHEIERLKQSIEKDEAQLLETIGRLEDFKTDQKTFKITDADSQSKAEGLNKELAGMEEKLVDQAKGSLEIIESLRLEIKTLKETQRHQQSSAEGFQQQMDALHQQKDKELSETVKFVEDLNAENDSLKTQTENSKVQIQELESRHAKTKEEHQRQLEITLKAVDSLKSENESLKAKSADIEDIATLKELNARLREQEKAAQYELAKSRAQAAGLEKICADFKAKFEGMEQLEEELKKAKEKLETLEKENSLLKGPQDKPV